MVVSSLGAEHGPQNVCAALRESVDSSASYSNFYSCLVF